MGGKEAGLGGAHQVSGKLGLALSSPSNLSLGDQTNVIRDSEKLLSRSLCSA